MSPPDKNHADKKTNKNNKWLNLNESYFWQPIVGVQQESSWDKEISTQFPKVGTAKKMHNYFNLQ